MASGETNRGRFRRNDGYFRRQNLPTFFYVALVDDSVIPDFDTNVLSDLNEISAGNGYTSGGISLSPNTTDFPSCTEDDSGDLSNCVVKDLTWTASGGQIPSSGSGPRYAVLTDDNATVGNRAVLAWWDLGSEQIRPDGLPLTLINLTIQVKKP